MAISFKRTPGESLTVSKIAKRALDTIQVLGAVGTTRLDIEMDLVAVNANGCPLDFEQLLAADDYSFAHDILGIRRHLNRTTGKINPAIFDPRCSRPQHSRSRRRAA